MGVTIEVKIDNTNTLLEALPDVKNRALMRCGAVVENYAKRTVPVDTGRLRNSLHHEMESEDTVAIGTDVEYGKYVELGTSRQRSKPYLKPAVADHVAEYQKIIESEFRKG